MERGTNKVKTFNFSRVTLSITAAAMLAACGGSPQIDQTPPQRQGDAASTPLPRAALSYSAPRPPANYPKRSHGLLYVGDYARSAIDVFPLTGPNQKQIGSISDGVRYPWGL